MFSFKKSKPESSIYENIYQKFSKYTMIPQRTFISNLALCEKFKDVEGSIVECGVWRGGMVAGLSELIRKSDKEYFLCDSYEGLPAVDERDGASAMQWQNDKSDPIYFDNCKAEESFAIEAMKLAGVDNYSIVKGWFNETLGHLKFPKGISILRLDGDWYESTMTCLSALYPHVNKGGVVVIDDYYTWDGCCQAVHDYLSKNKLSDRIREHSDGVAYIVKGAPTVYEEYKNRAKP